MTSTEERRHATRQGVDAHGNRATYLFEQHRTTYLDCGAQTKCRRAETFCTLDSCSRPCRWIYQQDVVIATSPGTNPTYIAEDRELASGTLTDGEMAALAKM